jgi:hypothetical protein
VPRRLLNIASIVCLVGCVALMGMWVRSCWQWDQLHGRFPNEEGFNVGTLPGRLVFHSVTDTPPANWSWGLFTQVVQEKPQMFGGLEHRYCARHLGFAAYRLQIGTALILPFWYLVLTSGLLAMAFQLRWPPQFNLRNMFVLTTFLAVMLGMIAWLDRARIGK